MSWRRSLAIALFLLALAAWCAAAFAFAPPHFGYRALYLAAGAGLFILTYWYPVAGLGLFLALTPVSNLPSRVLALGAHEALVFLALAFTLGWWAHLLVVHIPSGLDRVLVVPLTFVIVLGVSSGVWTALRYSGLYPLAAATFRNAWINLAGLHANEAIRRSVLALCVYLVFPCVLWATYSICRRMMLQMHTHEVPWRRAIMIWTLALLPVLLVAFYQREVNPSFGLLDEPAWRDARRVSGGMTDPNALGLFLCLYLPMAGVAAWKERGLRQMLVIVCGVAGLAALTFSGSRSALLGVTLTAGLVLAGLGFALLRSGASRARVAGVAAAVALVAVLMVTLLPVWQTQPGQLAENPLIARLQLFTERLHAGEGYSVVDRRELQWKQAVAVWKDYPFAGIGLGAFALEVPNYNRAAEDETPIDNAWNQYLQWLSELGLAGVFCWAWCYVAYLWLIGRSIRHNGLRTVTTPVFVMLAALASLQVLNVFGAHLHSSEVAVAGAVLAALALAHFSAHVSADTNIPARDIGVLALVALVVIMAQGQNALGPLSQREIQRRYDLPTEFGLYHVEDWQKMFAFQWSERFAGKDITVPAQRRVLALRLAAMDPDVSPAQPKLVKVWLDDQYLDTLTIDDTNWREYELFVYSRPSGPATLILECDRTWSPATEPTPRQLGIALATDIEWRDIFSRDGQGFADWHTSVIGNTTNRFRWMQSRAATMVTPGENGLLHVPLRAPADVPFYRQTPVATISYNNVPLLSLSLPRTADEWTTATCAIERRLRGIPGMLSISVDRLSPVRMPGSVYRRRAGAAVGPIGTE
jgi:O-antigen ligase